MIKSNSALLVVDMQNDFLPGGALGVVEADMIIPRVNEYVRLFEEHPHPIFYTRDWHPPETTHFVTQGGPWPPHCVQGTWGAAFHPDMHIPQEAIILSKGMDPHEDAYSGFHARDDQGHYLEELLLKYEVMHVYVCGLALDYCVKWSCIDAANKGFHMYPLIDATRAVNVKIHDAELAVEEIVRVGGTLLTIEHLREPDGESVLPAGTLDL
ncbi:MAG: isochorismatase family protein [Chloroflexi bacterium]|jgi:nicotinamidase/pyrazinamidase|nr:isochorismatase family protein [Chloroflexota bacterium]